MFDVHELNQVGTAVLARNLTHEAADDFIRMAHQLKGWSHTFIMVPSNPKDPAEAHKLRRLNF